jgi:phosphoglycerate dehydrogenase-like enzyme
MEARPLSAAVLDVTYPYEPVKEDSRFLSLPNIFLTPHIAGSASDEVHRMALYMAEECEKVTAGQAPCWEVVEAMLATMA